METPTPNPNTAQSQQQQPQTPKPEPQIVKEIHHHHYKRGASAGSIFFGFIIVIIGLVLLAKNAGWIPDTFSFDWNWIWPLIIIFIGVSILSKNGWVSWLIGGVVTLVVLGMLAMMLFGGWNTAKTAVSTDMISIEKNTEATSADVTLKTGAGAVNISGGSEKIVSGTYEHQGLTLSKKDETADHVQKVGLETTGNWNFWGRHANNFDLALNNDMPLSLTLGTGATDMTIDLTTINATNVSIDTGASDVKLIMGDKPDLSRVSVDAGASSISITLPKTVGAKIDLSAGATTKSLPDFIQRDDKTYETANYESSTKKIAFDMNLGAATLTFNWK